MGAYLTRRFLLMVLTLFGMSVLIFVMLRLVPGKVAMMAYSKYRHVPEVAIPDNVEVMVAERRSEEHTSELQSRE